MADKISAIRVKQIDGTYTEQIPISVTVQNVQWDKNNHNLLDALGNIDISPSGKGSLQHQINELDERIEVVESEEDDINEDYIASIDEVKQYFNISDGSEYYGIDKDYVVSINELKEYLNI